MTKIVKLIQSLPDVLSLKPATQKQILDAEIQLRLKFDEEYREYLAAFGAIITGSLELTGITKSEYRNVVALTQQEWALNPKVPHTMYVVENAYIDGIFIWQDTNGAVYLSKPNSAPFKIAESFSQYLSERTR